MFSKHFKQKSLKSVGFRTFFVKKNRKLNVFAYFFEPVLMILNVPRCTSCISGRIVNFQLKPGFGWHGPTLTNFCPVTRTCHFAHRSEKKWKISSLAINRTLPYYRVSSCTVCLWRSLGVSNLVQPRWAMKCTWQLGTYLGLFLLYLESICGVKCFKSYPRPAPKVSARKKIQLTFLFKTEHPGRIKWKGPIGAPCIGQWSLGAAAGPGCLNESITKVVRASLLRFRLKACRLATCMLHGKTMKINEIVRKIDEIEMKVNEIRIYSIT